MLSKNLTIQLLFLLLIPKFVEQMENDDDSKHKNTLENLVGPYATHKTLTTQHQFPSSHDEFSLQPYPSHQASTHPHQFPSPSLSHQQFIPNVQNPFSQHVENHSINPSLIQQSYEYSNKNLDYLNYNQQMNNNYSTDGNTLESFVGPYLTQKASTSIQQYQLPSSHQEHSLQLDNPSSSNINFQNTNIKTQNDVKEFLNKIKSKASGEIAF
uniref:Uncharacterized protein n=1 Tax=Meloidogyne floridensis TaxID=298350 RepID=A0A915NYI6_9BILA